MTIRETIKDYNDNEYVVIQENGSHKILFYGTIKVLRDYHNERLDTEPLVTIIKDDIRFIV